MLKAKGRRRAGRESFRAGQLADMNNQFGKAEPEWAEKLAIGGFSSELISRSDGYWSLPLILA